MVKLGLVQLCIRAYWITHLHAGTKMVMGRLEELLGLSQVRSLSQVGDGLRFSFSKLSLG